MLRVASGVQAGYKILGLRPSGGAVSPVPGPLLRESNPRSSFGSLGNGCRGGLYRSALLEVTPLKSTQKLPLASAVDVSRCHRHERAGQ